MVQVQGIQTHHRDRTGLCLERFTAAFYSTAKLLDKEKKLKRNLNALIKLSIVSDAEKARLHYWKWPENPPGQKES